MAGAGDLEELEDRLAQGLFPRDACVLQACTITSAGVCCMQQ
jgi:hypothetical protein